jgi:hypothetical protein
MRFERNGGPPDLQSAFTNLIVSRLHGRILDDNHAVESADGKFPDFGCFRDLMLIEMKHLETDQQDRINEVINTKLDPAENTFIAHIEFSPAALGEGERAIVRDFDHVISATSIIVGEANVFVLGRKIDIAGLRKILRCEANGLVSALARGF